MWHVQLVRCAVEDELSHAKPCPLDGKDRQCQQQFEQQLVWLQHLLDVEWSEGHHLTTLTLEEEEAIEWFVVCRQQLHDARSERDRLQV